MKSIITSIFTLLVLNSCGQMKVQSPAFDSAIRSIMPKDIPLISVQSLRDSLDLDNVVFLDSREKSEYEISHIKGAIWVGYDDFKLERLKGIDTSNTIIIYCSVGYRSGKIGEALKQKGYNNLYNLYGGIFEWTNTGGKVFNNAGETQKVHGYNKKWAVFLQRAKVVLP